MKRLLPILCALMAILIVVIGASTASYSWFEPDVKEGIGLEFKTETKLRSQNCSVATYSGSKGNKVTNYETSPVANTNVTVSATTSGETTTPGYAYFKTVITNSSADNDTVVSLFIPSFDIGDNSNASICVAVPTNSVRTYSADQADVHIVRNAYVPRYVAADANPGQIIIEWFVRCDVGSVTFNPSQVYLMYS